VTRDLDDQTGCHGVVESRDQGVLVQPPATLEHRKLEVLPDDGGDGEDVVGGL
jgi:hypothetical protein